MKENYVWYKQLRKPSWAPPTKVFGPVWTVLYIIIAITFGIVFIDVFHGKLPMIVALPFILNLLFNLVFTPIQFGLKKNFLAFIDILLVLATLIWFMMAVYPYEPWITLANIPYLAWVSFATILQGTIAYLNRKKPIGRTPLPL